MAREGKVGERKRRGKDRGRRGGGESEMINEEVGFKEVRKIIPDIGAI